MWKSSPNLLSDSDGGQTSWLNLQRLYYDLWFIDHEVTKLLGYKVGACWPIGTTGNFLGPLKPLFVGPPFLMAKALIGP